LDGLTGYIIRLSVCTEKVVLSDPAFASSTCRRTAASGSSIEDDAPVLRLAVSVDPSRRSVKVSAAAGMGKVSVFGAVVSAPSKSTVISVYSVYSRLAKYSFAKKFGKLPDHEKSITSSKDPLWRFSGIIDVAEASDHWSSSLDSSPAVAASTLPLIILSPSRFSAKNTVARPAAFILFIGNG
jgi:hypothetical protein